MSNLFLVWLLSMGACLASCRPTEEVGVDTSLLTGDPCGPPCWQGLVPGMSTEEDVVCYLAQSDYVGEYYRDTYAGSTTLWWQSTLPGRSQATYNAFGITDGTLSDMVIYLDYRVTLDRVLERYGPPDKLWAQWSTGGSAQALVNLYYPGEGFIPQLVVEPSDGHHELVPETLVTRVWYFVPTTLDQLHELRDAVPFPGSGYEQSELQDWAGYGRIDMR